MRHSGTPEMPPLKRVSGRTSLSWRRSNCSTRLSTRASSSWCEPTMYCQQAGGKRQERSANQTRPKPRPLALPWPPTYIVRHRLEVLALLFRLRPLVLKRAEAAAQLLHGSAGGHGRLGALLQRQLACLDLQILPHLHGAQQPGQKRNQPRQPPARISVFLPPPTHVRQLRLKIGEPRLRRAQTRLGLLPPPALLLQLGARVSRLAGQHLCQRGPEARHARLERVSAVAQLNAGAVKLHLQLLQPGLDLFFLEKAERMSHTKRSTVLVVTPRYYASHNWLT